MNHEYGVNGNGNGQSYTNGNGANGHKKVFELAPVKGPEEAEKEYVREIAPKIRKHVLFNPELSPGAKFFYVALLDMSFMHCYGGSGKGKLFSTVKDLARLLNHDVKSIKAWRDELTPPRWIWFRDEWPVCEWRICALCPAPEGQYVGEYQMTLGRAAGKSPDASFSAQNGQSHSKSQEFPPSVAVDYHCNGETFPSSEGESPTHTGRVSHSTEGETPTCDTKDSHLQRETLVSNGGRVSLQQREELAANKETPRSIGASGETGGGRTAPGINGWKANKPPLESHLPDLIAEQKAELKRTKADDPALPAMYEKLRWYEEHRYGAARTAVGAFHAAKPASPGKKPVPSKAPEVGPMPGTPEYEQFKREIRR